MDRSLEARAAELFAHTRYADAAQLYTQCLDTAAVVNQHDTINVLLNRASCHLKLRNFQAALTDCDHVLDLESDNEKALWKKVKVLCFQCTFQDAYDLASEWLQRQPGNKLAEKEIKRLEIVMGALKEQEKEVSVTVTNNKEQVPADGQTTSNTNHVLLQANNKRAETDRLNMPVSESSSLTSVSSDTDNSIISNNMSPVLSDSLSAGDEPVVETEDSEAIATADAIAADHVLFSFWRCSSCEISFQHEEEFDTHTMSDLHKKKMEAIDSQKWSYRPPPRGITSEEYVLCPRFLINEICLFGDKCTQAHSEPELTEWKLRFDQRKQQMKRSRETSQSSGEYLEQLHERLLSSENQELIITEHVEYAKVHTNADRKVTMNSKKSSNAWTFTVASKVPLHRTLLFDDGARAYFAISSVSIGPKRLQKYQSLDNQCQDWLNVDISERIHEHVYRIKVVFRTDIYGTFRQTVVFDFGSFPVLGYILEVQSTPSGFDKLAKEVILFDHCRWDENLMTIIEYEPKPISHSENETSLLGVYACPHPEKFGLSNVLFEPMQKETYRSRMHDLLYIEEMEQFGFITRFNIQTEVNLVDRYMLVPSLHTTAKYAVNGELFARMKVVGDISPDTTHGRLVLLSCQTALLAINTDSGDADSGKTPDKVYEVMIEDKGKNFIFFRLSALCVQELKLKADKNLKVQIQFQLNRLTFCEWHYAIDKLPDLDIVFPSIKDNLIIPWTPDKQWNDSLDSRLNVKQREAIIAITANIDTPLPPLLLVGPYGTGKTFTLAQAAKQVLLQSDTRVLICTHSNSAADLYIKEFFDPLVREGNKAITPLRIYYIHRWIQTVSPIVLGYSLRESNWMGNFRTPTLEDVEKHRVIVTTLSTSRYLCDLDLPKGFFTHIFLDEAAQAMECESLLPFSLAGPTTRIVLAGDHMQLSPEICSAFVKERDFHKSLLERLHDYYPNDFACNVMLCENYRSHQVIIDFTSELFYDKKLVSSGNQPPHDIYYPLTFFMAHGEEEQHSNSTGFYNNAELYEIADRVEEIQTNWPKEWGTMDQESIGVITPYADQVARIRGELRKRKLSQISVERVLNVQDISRPGNNTGDESQLLLLPSSQKRKIVLQSGKQFRVIILSTVRTRNTCCGDSLSEDLMDYGFLSNVKLLNTAITRAQSLVAVVGDPVSLCSVGKCRKIWEHFIQQCSEHHSLHGITWQQIRLQLDGMEMKRTYVLNPNAPEFIPNHMRHGAGLHGSDLIAGTRPGDPNYMAYKNVQNFLKHPNSGRIAPGAMISVPRHGGHPQQRQWLGGMAAYHPQMYLPPPMFYNPAMDFMPAAATGPHSQRWMGRGVMRHPAAGIPVHKLGHVTHVSPSRNASSPARNTPPSARNTPPPSHQQSDAPSTGVSPESRVSTPSRGNSPHPSSTHSSPLINRKSGQETHGTVSAASALAKEGSRVYQQQAPRAAFNPAMLHPAAYRAHRGVSLPYQMPYSKYPYLMQPMYCAEDPRMYTAGLPGYGYYPMFYMPPQPGQYVPYSSPPRHPYPALTSHGTGRLLHEEGISTTSTMAPAHIAQGTNPIVTTVTQPISRPSSSGSPSSTGSGQQIQILPKVHAPHYVPPYGLSGPDTEQAGSSHSGPSVEKPAADHNTLPQNHMLVASNVLRSIKPSTTQLSCPISQQNRDQNVWVNGVKSSENRRLQRNGLNELLAEKSADVQQFVRVNGAINGHSSDSTKRGTDSSNVRPALTDRRNAAPSKLNFSLIKRQQSEELKTPTQIYDLMKMIEESVDDRTPESLKLSGFPPIDEHQSHSQHNTGEQTDSIMPSRSTTSTISRSEMYSIVSGVRNQQLASSPPNNSSMYSSGDESIDTGSPRPTYAGILRRPAPSPVWNMQSPPAQGDSVPSALISPFSPPVCITTPSRELMETDALDILRNLNIQAASPDSQQPSPFYKYFS